MNMALVIPTYNEEHHLPLLLESISKQTLRPTAVIVADANSTDLTPSIAEDYNCTLVAGGTPAVGRNRGANIAQAAIVIFMDADTRLESDSFFEAAVRTFEERRLDVAKCWARNESTNGLLGRLAVSSTNLRNVIDVFAAKMLGRTLGGSAFFIAVRREGFLRLVGFDETLSESEYAEFLRRAVRAGFRFGLLPCSVRLSGRRYDVMSTARFLRTGALFVACRIAAVVGCGLSEGLLKMYRESRGPLGGRS